MNIHIIKGFFCLVAIFLMTPLSAKPTYHYNAKQPTFTAVLPTKIKWQPDTSLPKGAFNTVLEGKPSQKGPFTIREKIPPHFKLVPHWHTGAEHVTVISGVFYTGKGDTFNKKDGVKLPAGSYSVNPPMYHHFGWTEEKGAIIPINGAGPWTRSYADKSNDPRQSK